MYGLIVPSVTPFKGPNLDLEGVQRLCAYYKRAGVRYLFPVGTTGEFPLLTFQERQDLLAAFVAACSQDATIIAHVGAASTLEAQQLSAHAASLGIRYAAAVTPFYFAYDEQALLQYYRDLCAAQPDMNFFAYTIPQRASNTLSVEALDQLKDIPNLIGVKDSTGDLTRLRELTALGHLDVVAGADQHALPFLQAGGLGFVSGPGAIIPEVFQALMTAFEAGDTTASETAFRLICEFALLVENGGRIDLLRAGLKWRGVDTGDSRLPLPQQQNDPAFFHRLDAFAVQVRQAGISFSAPAVAAAG